jgi:hypothetical protein
MPSMPGEGMTLSHRAVVLGGLMVFLVGETRARSLPFLLGFQ